MNFLESQNMKQKPKKYFKVFGFILFFISLIFLLGISLFEINPGKFFAIENDWTLVGDIGFSRNQAEYTSLAILSNIAGVYIPYVAYIDSGNSVSVMNYNSAWTQVGDAGFADSSDYTSIAVSGIGVVYITFQDSSNNGKATVMNKTALTNWALVGSAGFSTATSTYNVIKVDSNGIPYVAYTDDSSGSGWLMKYDSGSWVAVGGGSFASKDTSYMSLAIDNNNIPYVAYRDESSGGKITVLKYEGSWSEVGSAGFSTGAATHISLAIDNSNVPYVAYSDDDNSGVGMVMKYDDGFWRIVGALAFSSAATLYNSLVIDDNYNLYVAYVDDSVGRKATVMKYTKSTDTWALFGSQGFSAGRADYTSLAIDGEDNLYVVYQDSTVGSGAATLMKYLDLTAPTITGLSNDSTPTKSKTWTWDSDDVNATYRYQKVTSPIPIDLGWSSYSNTVSIAQSSGTGTYYLHVQAQDRAGNVSSVTTVSAVLDNTSPVITILGNNPQSVYQHYAYTDAGATSTDNIDGDLTSSIVTTSNVNTSLVGSYTVTYVVSDSLGNVSTSTRVVNVVSQPTGGGGTIILPPVTPPVVPDTENNDNETAEEKQSSGLNFWTDGRFIKTEDSATIYFVDSDNIKYAYPDLHTWQSYFKNDFSKVETVSKQELDNYLTGADVPHKIGSLIKITSSPKVYKVTENKVLRWIINENVANRLFGNVWNKLVRDISEIFFKEYNIGDNIE